MLTESLFRTSPTPHGGWLYVRHAVAMVLCVALAQTMACTSTGAPRSMHLSDVKDPGKEEIVGVTTLDGDVVMFDGPAKLRDRTLSAEVGGKPYEIRLERVQRLWLKTEKFSAGKTLGVTAAIVGGAVLVALLLKESCPFVYSWDGEKYVFDAEPYGGAITRGLERDDYARLEYLRPDGGVYRLRVTNEVDETQFTNFAELWVVDHPPGARVLPDLAGELHIVSEPHPPVAARDKKGRDLLRWLISTDRRIWESTVEESSNDLRDEIVMAFSKPVGVTHAMLVTSASTGLWGSHMIREMLRVRGRSLKDWHFRMDTDPSYAEQVHAWSLKEELYALQIEQEEPSGWRPAAILMGEGPFVAEDRVALLDLTGVVGDELRLRIHPPKGFWALNSFAVDYGPGEAVRPVKVAIREARDSNGRNLLPDLASVDDRYHEMPIKGDIATLAFPAPSQRPGMERTVFLHSRGYYRLHLPAEGDPDFRTIDQIEQEPGGAARFAAERFREWRQNQAVFP